MIPAAAGATTPNACTCAMTSCLLFFSSSAAISNCFRSRYYTESDTKYESIRSPAPLKKGEGKVGVTNEIIFHLFDSLIGDRKPELLLRDGEVQPEFSPSMVSVLVEETAWSAFLPSSSASR